jgi:SAM-dependent methyltransferase
MIDAARIAAYYDTQAAQYDVTMAGEPRNAALRDGFLGFVAGRIPAAARILDFGCGTGLDAAWYASHGHTVIAYDPSSGMIDQVATRCAREIAKGAIIPVSAPFARFPDALPLDGRVDAIVANFAVLNLVADLPDLFRRFARVVGPGGIVLVSVLNPLYWRDLRYAWWWRGLPASWRTGMLSVEYGDTASYRHHLGTYARAARPAFIPLPRRGLLAQFTFLGFRRG